MFISSLQIQAAPAKHPSNLLSTTNPSQIAPKTPSIPLKSRLKPIKISSSSSSQTQQSPISNDVQNRAKEKLGVVVKPMERPRLVLRFIWMEKNIGVAIDQVIPGGRGTIPVSPYYFWPRKDAWEELKVMLESKPWISNKQMVVLLNQATDIINLWQQSGGGLA